MINSDNAKEREEAAHKISSTFSLLENKEQASKDLLVLIKDQNSDVRRDAAVALGSAFQYLADKDQATKDLLKLAKDQNIYVRWASARAQVLAFQYLTNKEHAWKNLVAILKDNYCDPRVFPSLGSVFQYLTEKKQAWKDLLELTIYQESGVQWIVAESLGSGFQYLTEREQATKDLLALTQDEDKNVRWIAACSLGPAFQYLTDKEQASKELLELTKDEDSHVRWSTAGSLDAAFQYLTDKEKASKALLELTKDKDSHVRWRTAFALGTAFKYLANKEQASKDLAALAKDEDSDVRVYANHSLGKISVYKATNAEDEDVLQKELENAIGFFEKSAQESKWFNPAKFCLPFYRSYYSVIFKKQEAEDEVKKNLDEAKHAVSGSESKKKLLEAVENLSNALNEAQKLRNLDDIKADLKGYRRYCDRACELLDTTKDKAPGATELIRRGLPVIDERIQGILGEIEEKSKIFCKDSQQTPFGKIGRTVHESATGLSKEVSWINAEKRMNRMVPLLRSMCNFLPEECKSTICSQLNEVENVDLDYKALIMESAMSSLYVQMKNFNDTIDEKDKMIEYFKDLILGKLDNIDHGIFKLKLRSGEIVPALQKMQNELKKLELLKNDINNLGLNLTDLSQSQYQEFTSLDTEISHLVKEININVIPRLSQSDDSKKLLEKLQKLEQSKGQELFYRAAALSSIIGMIIAILQAAMKS